MTTRPEGADAGASIATPFDLATVVARLRAQREAWRAAHHRTQSGGREFPSPPTLQRIVEDLSGALFPMRLGPPDLRHEGEDYYVGHTLDRALRALLEQVRLELRRTARTDTDPDEPQARAASILKAFAASLPDLRARLDRDVEAAFHGDPAAHSVDEVLLCYPGIVAMVHHRIAHELHRLGVPLLARIIAEIAHGATGIDIHPGARIGDSFFIDHGTGVVIGETAVIGSRVRLYQAVTLGAKRFSADADGHLRKGDPRHPIVEDDVVIYAGATILGRITIGRGSTIGGNVWLTRSVPPNSHVTLATSQYDVRESPPGG
jgi:serine O-acetyltransferase